MVKYLTSCVWVLGAGSWIFDVRCSVLGSGSQILRSKVWNGLKSETVVTSVVKNYCKEWRGYLTLSWRRPWSYRNQSIGLRSKSMDWFLYDNCLRHERVKSETGITKSGTRLSKIVGGIAKPANIYLFKV